MSRVHHATGYSQLLIQVDMKTAATKRIQRPLPRVSEEVRHWSGLLLEEILRWPRVTARPMFGMTAVYHGKSIFGVLPRTCAMDTPSSVSFKLGRREDRTIKAMAADRRILPLEAASNCWISFELQSAKDLPDALRWFQRAYRKSNR